MQTLAEKEMIELVRLLGLIDPKAPYGTELFNALARLTASVAVETVCMRLKNTAGWSTTNKDFIGSNIPEVYLIQRAINDTAYPGEWHCPGSVIRPGEDIEDVLNRLAQKEFGGKILSAQFIANANHPTEARGHFFSLVYLCSLDESSTGLRGQWFEANNLPEKTVETHRVRIIPAAYGAFVAKNTKICR